ncbi:glycosyltransferase family 2 protein [Paraburkholderia sp. BCC1884]|uniref:glycosyltransferase family 2 protein n=1 Tax=Paraburkholderia sp. BCC1884 TaxID=2562668 RepID=UPI0011830D23|nr:glycosyltransferase family A protein [Paraburkholderia sp. BCC1884]
MTPELDKKTGAAPTVVVVIPYYNGSQWLERAVKSVVNQTVKANEFIVVNDGSTPQERAALEPLTAKYGFTVLDKANGGQGSARNAGVAATTSEYISFLDQDDYYFPNHIQDLVGALPADDPRLGFVYADLCEADGDGNIVHSNMLRAQLGQHPKQGHITTMLRNDIFVLPSASLIRRSSFEALGGFDEQFMGYEDDDLFLRMFRSGYTNHFLDKPVTAWCMHTGSTSYSIKMSRSRFRYFKKLAFSFKDEPRRKMFFFHECLVPRFGDVFIREALEASKVGDPNREELCAILKEYSDMVAANPFVPMDYKTSVQRVSYLTTRMKSKNFQRLATLRKLPVIRSIVRRLI